MHRLLYQTAIVMVEAVPEKVDQLYFQKAKPSVVQISRFQRNTLQTVLLHIFELVAADMVYQLLQQCADIFRIGRNVPLGKKAVLLVLQDSNAVSEIGKPLLPWMCEHVTVLDDKFWRYRFE